MASKSWMALHVSEEAHGSLHPLRSRIGRKIEELKWKLAGDQNGTGQGHDNMTVCDTLKIKS